MWSASSAERCVAARSSVGLLAPAVPPDVSAVTPMLTMMARQHVGRPRASNSAECGRGCERRRCVIAVSPCCGAIAPVGVALLDAAGGRARVAPICSVVRSRALPGGRPPALVAACPCAAAHQLVLDCGDEVLAGGGCRRRRRGGPWSRRGPTRAASWRTRARWTGSRDPNDGRRRRAACVGVSAIASASTTSSALRASRIDQPTTRRLYQSISAAR
jgi:hypothetical protein